MKRLLAVCTERPLAVVALAAAAIRAAYFAAHARSAFFLVPVLDARWFHEAATAIAVGTRYAGFEDGFRSALYPLLLSLTYRLAGDSGLVLAQLVQHAAGVATAVAVAALARRISQDSRAALAAGLLYALAPVPLFFEGELLAEPLYLAGSAGLLLLVGRAPASPPPVALRAAAIDGALLAALAQLRPTAWLMLAALPFVGARAGRRARAAALVAGFGAATWGLAAVQAPFTGELRLLPASSGINLFLGNRRGADGLVPRAAAAPPHGSSYRDSVATYAATEFDAARARGETGAAPADAAAARDAYWRRRTLEEVRSDPAGRLALLARKAVVVLWNGEVPNNRDFAFAARQETPLLGWLPARFGLLFALACVGFAASPRSPTRDGVVAYALLHAAGVVLFFVADRYRLALYPPVAVLAGVGLTALLQPSLAKPRRLALFAAAALVSFVDWTGARRQLPGFERDLYFRSIARFETGDPAGALDDASRAAALAPSDPYPHLQTAIAALALDRLDAAERYLRRATELAPDDPRVLNAWGLWLERRGDLEGARARFAEALAKAPDFAPARHNLERTRPSASESAASRP